MTVKQKSARGTLLLAIWTACFLSPVMLRADDYINAILADNPAGWWRFEETSGTVALDWSGNERHGTYVGGVSLGQPGMMDGSSAVMFNGFSGLVQLPGAWGGLDWTELTVAAWVNTADPITGEFQSIVSGHSPNAFTHFQLHSVGNSGVYTSSGFVAAPIAPATPTGEWRHIVLTAKSGETRVYVNGVQLGGTVPTAFNNVNAATNVTIGQGHVGTRWFHGLIDEVAIYNTALPSERVLAHFTAAGREPPPPPPPPPPAALLAHWKFDTDASDATGNHPGTLQGGASVTGDARVGGGALDLRGVGGYVEVPTSVLGNQPSFTIAMFVSVDSLTNGCCSALLTTPGWMLDSLHLNIATANGVPELAVNGNAVGAWGRDPNGPVPADGSWVHLAYTYDGNQGVVTPYINGVAGTPTSGTLRPTAGGGPLTIGMWNNDRFLDGRIDDLRIYSGVLTPEGIASLATGSDPTTADLNGDGVVDRLDVLQFLAHYGSELDATAAMGDLTGDGAVGLADLHRLQLELNADQPQAAVAAVPEPGTAALGFVAVLLMAGRRGYRRFHQAI